MEALIARTSMSPFIREKKDFFTAFLDRDGNLVVSTALTLAGNLVAAILEQYPREDMRDGRPLLVQRRVRVQGRREPGQRHGVRDARVRRRPACRLHRGLGAPVGRGRHVSGLGQPACDQRVPRRHHDPAGARHARRCGQRRGGAHLPAQLALPRDDEGRPQRHHGGGASSASSGCRRPSRATAARSSRRRLPRCCVRTRPRCARQIDTYIPEGRWRFRDRIDSDAATDNAYHVEAQIEKKAGRSDDRSVRLVGPGPGCHQLRHGSTA